MKILKIWLLTFIGFLYCLLPLAAQKFSVDGIYYEVISQEQGVKVVSGFPDRYKGNIVIPATVRYDGHEYKVIAIGDGAFSYCDGLTSIDLGNVQTIGDGAFESCDGLTSIFIPSMITAIKGNVFADCPNLVSIVVDDSNLIYSSPNGCNAIVNTKARTLVCGCVTTIVPDDIQTIGECAFSGCEGLTSIDFKNVQTIEDWAFKDCRSLTSVDFKNICTIGYGAFQYCDGLTSLDFGNVQTIEECAFSGCDYLISIDFKNVQTIGGWAFESCDGLTSVFIPSMITAIKGSVFTNCRNLVSIVVDDSNPIYSSPNGCNAIINTDAKTLVCGCVTTVIPDDIQTIGEDAFSGCEGLTSIDLKNVQTIEQYAFNNCDDLLSIDLKNVQTVGACAFSSCYNLRSVRTRKSVPGNLDSNAFSQDMYEYGNLQVPYESVSVYKAQAPWNYFRKITGPQIDLYDDVSNRKDIYAETDDAMCSRVDYLCYFRNSTDWRALYLPFGMEYADWFHDFQIARINNIHQYDDNYDGIMDRTLLEVVILPENSTTQPNIPYLIRAKQDGYKLLRATEVLLKRAESASIDCSSVDYHYTFTGTYQGLTGDEMYNNKYYALAPGGLKQAASNKAKLDGFRWYMSVENRHANQQPLPQTLSLRVLDEFGQVTEIEDAHIEQGEAEWPADIYNMKGQLVKSQARNMNEVPEGIYIVNGKKIIK